MEKIQNDKKSCNICGENAENICFKCSMHLCESCSKFIHEKKINKNHKIEKIDYYIPFPIKCLNHPKDRINLFCLDDKELGCSICEFKHIHKGHKLIYIEDVDSLKKEKIDLDSSINCFNIFLEKIRNLKEKIENEINKINLDYDTVFSEIKESYEKKHEKLEIEENNLIENLQNEVTKIKEQLENFLSKSDSLIRIGERINKGIKLYLKENNENVLKNLAYISYISKNQKEIELLLGKLIKNNKIYFNKEKNDIIYKDYNFSGIPLPKNIQFEDINSKSIKVLWNLDNIKVENLDINKINFKLEIKKANTDDIFIKVYEGPNNNCLINNLNKNTNYEIRICSIYNDINSDWIQAQKSTDYISESIILNQNNKNLLLNMLSPLYKGKNIYLKLIYRRGNDFSYETFHSKCDNKGHTVVICKSDKEIFGGYTNINWESKNGIKIFDSKNFVFNLNKNKKYDYNKGSNCSMYLHKNHGPDFFWDLTFNAGDKKMKVCFCAIKANGYAYSKDPLIGDGSSKEINVDEVEVFKIKSH